MSGSQVSTVIDETEVQDEHNPQDVAKPLDLSELPKFFVLPTHLTIAGLDQAKGQLSFARARITNDLSDASIILTNIKGARRARFELQTRKFEVKEISYGHFEEPVLDDSPRGEGFLHGKRKRGQEREAARLSSTTDKDAIKDRVTLMRKVETHELQAMENEPGWIKIVNLEWLLYCIRENDLYSLAAYLVCDARVKIPAQELTSVPSGSSRKAESQAQDQQSASTSHSNLPRRRPFDAKKQKKPSLVRETTLEHDEPVPNQLPEMPQWVKDHKIYACERVAPSETPNDEFVSLLKKIRSGRELIDDEIGVRAYSTSIASIAAYPHRLRDPREVLALPGCQEKIADLFREYKDTGGLSVVESIEKDAEMQVIGEFYGIWGVGAKTARQFYHDRGWRDRDDIVQHGWNELSRQQQIGLKFYDEFEIKIPKAEVEFIASVITYHAKQILGDEATCAIVGGYRRGKAESGDVDVVISHPDPGATSYLITPLVQALETSGWITHLLKLTETHSEREERPLDLRVGGARGSGFDTLDKALVVWQDPSWPNKAVDLAADPSVKNPNVHRRVDIIVSPWRTVGCAVTGWSSGTTFQRDLRRYARKVKGWKFDSSGVRDRATGRWIDLERWTDESTRAKTWLEAERRVFEGLGLEWIEPCERCTG